MEEKLDKNGNKGLIIGMIIFLLLCLGFSVFFIFQVMSDDNSNKQSENNESETIPNEEPSELAFTELTKYELNEGETKEIEIGNKKFTLNKKESKLYVNDKEIDGTDVSVTNNLIISSAANQFATVYYFYDLDLNKLTLNNIEGFRLSNLYLENEKLLVKAHYNSTEREEGQVIGNLIVEPCKTAPKTAKKLSEYQEVITQHENDVIKGTYKIKYINNQITLELYETEQTVKQYLESVDSTKMCAEERNS